MNFRHRPQSGSIRPFVEREGIKHLKRRVAEGAVRSSGSLCDARLIAANLVQAKLDKAKLARANVAFASLIGISITNANFFILIWWVLICLMLI